MNALAINLDPAVMRGAGIVFLVGLGIVFIALFVIILILMLQALIFSKAGSGKKAEKKAAAPAPAPAPVQAAAPVEDDAEIAAVIAAVVAIRSARSVESARTTPAGTNPAVRSISAPATKRCTKQKANLGGITPCVNL